MQKLETLLENAKKEIASANDLKTLEQHKVHYLGKKGELTEELKNLGKLSPEERPAAGQKINKVKELLQIALNERTKVLTEREIQSQLDAEAIDITLPGRQLSKIGTIHPINKTINDLKSIFFQMGFIHMEGPEIEDDYHNFTALNIPPLHPARAMQDTFYFENGSLLRTQTSTVQIRAMSKMKPPLRIMALGRVYRRDFDLTHTPMFHQMEGLMIDKGISFANLKGILFQFLRAFFESNIDLRFRPSYFPFTEPSAEVDITCIICKGNGCRICKNTGWLEVLGCGMVHPNVLREVGIDSNIYSGFAFGAGLDRLTLLKYQISDLRSLFENDLRFLKQFN